jgi:hypothetical protein
MFPIRIVRYYIMLKLIASQQRTLIHDARIAPEAEELSASGSYTSIKESYKRR